MSKPGSPSNPIEYNHVERAQPTPRSGQDSDTPKPRKYVTTACDACKQAKAKCNGANPCARCATKSLACFYRLGEDGRDRTSLKRKITDLQSDSDMLHQLLELIKGSTNDDVAQVLAMIRGGASLEELHNCLVRLSIEAANQRTRVTPELDEVRRYTESVLSQQSNSRSLPQKFRSSPPRDHHTARAVLGIDRLTDIPPYEVPASPWTEVVQDDHLVSHLISLWAVWNHNWADGIILDYFLRDMRSQKLGSPFCSPFLVNSMLAYACPLSDYEEARTSKGKISDLAERFAKEAQAHLAKDLSASISTLQGLITLFLNFATIGQDAQGYYYCVQAVAMRSELIRDRTKILKSANSDTEKKELSYVLDYAIWGAFNVMSTACLGYRRTAHFTEYSRPFPNPTGLLIPLHNQGWESYPRPSEQHSPCYDNVMQQNVSLAAIQQELFLVLYTDLDGQNSVMTRQLRDDLVVIDFKLSVWRNGLPTHLKDVNVLPSPCVGVMHWLWAYVSMVTLTARLTQAVPNHTSPATTLSGTENSNATTSPDQLRRRLVTLALNVVQVIEAYDRSLMDFSRIQIVAGATFALAMNVFIDADNIWFKDERRYDSQISQISVVLRAMARRHPWIVALFRTTQLDCRRRGIRLPESTMELFGEFEASTISYWKQQSSAESKYSPFYLEGVNEGEDARGSSQPLTISDFLKKFDALDMQEN